LILSQRPFHTDTQPSTATVRPGAARTASRDQIDLISKPCPRLDGACSTHGMVVAGEGTRNRGREFATFQNAQKRGMKMTDRMQNMRLRGIPARRKSVYLYPPGM